MEPPLGLQAELQRLADQTTDLSSMNQLSRTFLQLLHGNKLFRSSMVNWYR